MVTNMIRERLRLLPCERRSKCEKTHVVRILLAENLYLLSMGCGGRGYSDDRGSVVEDGAQSDLRISCG